MTHTPNKLYLDIPAHYQVRVQGRLDERFSDRLGGMTIAHASQGDEPAVTILEGQLQDQAALFCVLNYLYELHLSLLSVVCLAIG